MLMEDFLHQLRLVLSPIIYGVLYIPGGFLAISSIKTVVSGHTHLAPTKGMACQMPRHPKTRGEAKLWPWGW